jgi:hypothetical protein
LTDVDGKRYEITFGSKGPCDVTVGIADGEGTIVRHLACDKDGVYMHNGNNASWYIGGEGTFAPDLTSILVYDHQGNYARAIYPFPRDKIKPEAYARSPLYGQGPPSGQEPVMKHGPPFRFVPPSGQTTTTPLRASESPLNHVLSSPNAFVSPAHSPSGLASFSFSKHYLERMTMYRFTSSKGAAS